MSHRAHFWLRIVGLGVVVVLEFGPRLWTLAAGPAQTTVAAASIAR